MRERQPIIGNRYTIEEQCEFHGGNPKASAPDKDGRMVLVRVHQDRNPNPDAPLIMDWRRKNTTKPPAMLQQGGIPFYNRRQANEWEYIGKFEVVYATTNPTVCAWRSGVTGVQINEVLFLEAR
jgi:hypothetical protein